MPYNQTEIVFAKIIENGFAPCKSKSLSLPLCFSLLILLKAKKMSKIGTMYCNKSELLSLPNFEIVCICEASEWTI